jgi:pantetheine-phosphate adenylyltransferase
MELFKPSLDYDIVPIHDVYGPTATDPNIQALVVSKETASGGRAGKCLMAIVSLGGVFMYICAQVDKRRGEKGLPRLRTFAIDVISHSSYRLEAEDVETLKQAKMSSTYIRQWIVSRQRDEM